MFLQVCLCSTHTQLKFAFEDFIKASKKNGIPLPDVDHYVELIDEILCSEDERTRDCLKEKCSNCGIKSLDTSFFEPFVQGIQDDSVVTFRSLEKDDTGRLGIQDKSGTPQQLVDHLKSHLRGFPLHRFVAKNQPKEMNFLLKNLNPDVLVLSSDYAEKYQRKEFEEVQSIHWHSHSLTIFTTVAFFLIPDPDNPRAFKKTKVYFFITTERPEQDNYFAAFCYRLIIKWIRDNFKASFTSCVFGSDRCAQQFCSRKVFGSIAESRRNLCLNHTTSTPLCPNCPQAIIHFTGAGHGKEEHDHVGAYGKTKMRLEELHQRPLRSIHDVANFLQTLNFIDIHKTKPGKEDTKGFFYSGFHAEVVEPAAVQTSKADWDPIDQTRTLHQLITTGVSGELLVRESSCFSCAECEFGNYAACKRTEELGPIKKVIMSRASSNSSAHKAGRSRARQDLHRYECAKLAQDGSVIAINQGPHQQLNLILVTKAMGDLTDPNLLKGRVLVKTNTANEFTSLGSKLLSFSAELVRSPPLDIQTSQGTVNGKTTTIYHIGELEFSSLVAEYLF